MVVTGAGKWEKWGDVGQRSQALSNKFWESKVQDGDICNIIVNNIILYT